MYPHILRFITVVTSPEIRIARLPCANPLVAQKQQIKHPIIHVFNIPLLLFIDGTNELGEKLQN